jgi:hypothetical protein
MRWVWFGLLIVALSAGPALAVDPSAAGVAAGVVGCADPAVQPTDTQAAATGEPWRTPRQLLDGSVNLAGNRFGDIDQSVGAVAMTFSQCDGQRNGRWRVEGNLAVVDDRFGTAESALFGVGYQFALGSQASITPVARIGYAHFDTIDDQLAAGVGVVIAGSVFLDKVRKAKGVWLTIEAAPEYTRWQSAATGLEGFDFGDGVFSNFAAVGLDLPLWGRYRGRVRLGNRYIDSDGPTRTINSAIFSFRRDPVGKQCGRGCWNADLWLSEGDGDYQSVLFGLSTPIGR